MYNDKPCDTCDHYDPVLKGKQGKLVNTVWGWCAERSVYPHTEGPGTTVSCRGKAGGRSE